MCIYVLEAMSVRAKKFHPPLKANIETRTSWLSPSLSSAPTSQNSGGDSLPATQTHTILSYCENDEDNEHSESSEDHSPTSSESEAEAEIEVTSRFKRHTPYPLPKTYGYRTHTERNKKRTVADLERTLGKGKVRISLPVAGVGQRSFGGELSVYDCQPTPPESVGVVRKDVAASPQSKAEQLAIDREVITLIKKTRLELQKIREKYRYARHHYGHLQSVGVIGNKPLPLSFTPSKLVNED